MHLQTKHIHHAVCVSLKRKWSVLWRLFRPHTLTASFVPVILGTVLSLPYGTFRMDVFVAMLLASMLIQIATNMFNEYYDYKSGLDHEHSVGIAGAIVRDSISPKKILTITQIILAIALLLGLYLCIQSSWWLLPVGLCSAAVGFLYSGGPIPISATPFGELVSGILMGLVIIVISFFIQTGAVTAKAILVSIPTSILIGAILMANNIRDLENDKEHGRQTLAILLGRTQATYCLIGMFTVSYLWVILLIAIDVVSLGALVSFVSLPQAFRSARGIIRNSKNPSPESLMPYMVATAQTNTLFGLFLTLGLFLEVCHAG